MITKNVPLFTNVQIILTGIQKPLGKKVQPLLWLCLIVFPICIQSRRVCEALTSQTIAVCTWQYHTERRSKELISSLLKLLFPPLVKSCCFMVQHRQGGEAPPKKKKGRFSLQGQCTHNGLLSCSQTYCWLQERCECVCFWAIVCIWKWVCIWWCVCKWEAGLQYKGITLWMIISSCLIRCINFALKTWALGESDILIKDHEERKR